MTTDPSPTDADDAGVEEHWADRYAVHATISVPVLLSERLRAFLARCLVENRHAVLMTPPTATLSPFVAAMLGEIGGHWVLWRRGEPIREARTGLELSSYEALWQEPAAPVPTLPPHGRAMIAFDLHTDHRAEASTRIGDVATEIMTALGGAAPRRWGTVEPLADPWSVGAITAAARRTMPDSVPLLVESDDGYAYLTVSRTARGVRETLRGAVVRDVDETTALDLAETVARDLAQSRHRVLTASFSLLHAPQVPRRGPGPAPSERMLASYVGPGALFLSAPRTTALAARHGGSVVGRARVPGLVVPFPGPATTVAERYRALVADLTEELAA